LALVGSVRFAQQNARARAAWHANTKREREKKKERGFETFSSLFSSSRRERVYTHTHTFEAREKESASRVSSQRALFGEKGERFFNDFINAPRSNQRITRENVQPTRARDDEEDCFLLPGDGADGERGAGERSRCGFFLFKFYAKSSLSLFVFEKVSMKARD